jgi:hypothetical protein
MMGDEARMLGAFEDLVKLGRNFGIGVTLISQRPQAVNKDALNQTECLVVLQTNGAQERKAISDWIVEQSLDVEDLVDELPGLKRGEAWVWSPSWLRKTVKVHIGKKRTFDASATPEAGPQKSAAPRELAAAELEQLRASMKDVVARAEADDPKALRRTITELQAKLKKAETAIPTPAKVERVEVPVLDEKVLKRLESLSAEALLACAQLELAAKDVRAVAGAKLAVAPLPLRPPPPVNRREVAARAPPGDRQATGPTDATVGNSGLRRMLIALAQRPQGLTNKQLGVRAGVSSRSGTFSTYLGRARSQGWVEGRGDLRITEAGISALGSYEPLPEGADLAVYWLRELGNSGAARILRTLIDAYPNSLDATTVGERAEISPKSGTYSTYVGRLRSLELVSGRGELRASDELFST